jgi:hypothetical protein
VGSKPLIRMYSARSKTYKKYSCGRKNMLAKEIISIPQHTLPQNKSPFSKWRWGCFAINVFCICYVSQNLAFFRICVNFLMPKCKIFQKCTVTHATNRPPPIFSITARALRHLNKLRCVFCIQNIDFTSQLPNTYLNSSLDSILMPPSCMSIHSQGI